MLNWIGRHRLRNRPSAPAELAQPDTQPAPARPSVLVIDDDLYIGRLIIDALGADYAVEVACDAREAEAWLELHHPDLIILDIMMPGMDGQEIGHQLRRRASTRNIPFILVSGDRRIAEKAQQAGAAAYLAKPFDVDELCALVARTLSEGGISFEFWL